MATRRSQRRYTRPTSDLGINMAGSNRWMISYSDFMTLLFVVFMVLFSSARVDNQKYAAIAAAFQEYMGLGNGGGGLAPLPTGGESESGDAVPITSDEGDGTESTDPDWLVQFVESQPSKEDRTSDETPSSETTPAAETQPVVVQQPAAQDGSGSTSQPSGDSMGQLAEAFQVLPGARSGVLSVALQERGLVISIAGSVLFDPGEATLKSSAQAYLDQIAAKLQGVELPIMVEGTADKATQSGQGGYTSWDLAALRAGAVVNYFVQHHGIPGSRFVTIGYGSAETADRSPDMVTIVVLRKES